MRGTMLWFNVDKGYGFIHSEDDERLSVDRSGFLPDHEPGPRCRGLEVAFRREVLDGVVSAVEVAFVAPRNPRRARLRHTRGGSSL